MDSTTSRPWHSARPDAPAKSAAQSNARPFAAWAETPVLLLTPAAGIALTPPNPLTSQPDWLSVSEIGSSVSARHGHVMNFRHPVRKSAAHDLFLKATP